MEKVAPSVYEQINNEVYKARGDIWWKPDTVLHLLKTSINPWRVGYAINVLKGLSIDPTGKTALEVGSGGGILTEEICKNGIYYNRHRPGRNVGSNRSEPRQSHRAVHYL